MNWLQHDPKRQERRQPGECTAFVATIGGHISELVELADRMALPDRQVWITNDSLQTQDLLRGRTVEVVPYIGERDHAGVLKSIPQAFKLLRRYGVTRVVSTGSAIALGYLPLARALGIETHYIESSTRVHSCSVTGRVLARIPGLHCWWQFADAPPGFTPIAGVYDRYLSAEAETDPGSVTTIKRAVVTLGTTDRGFERLITRLIEVLPPETEVLWQTGHTDVTGLGIDAQVLVPEAQLVEAIAEADVVITHAGAGSLALALRAGRVPVFVPRRAEYDEHLDNHQVELAEWAGRNDLAILVEADQVRREDLLAAARRKVVENPVGELVLI